eukprot:Nk52_evm17s279 gene=Nk52_evmTU17s279
MSATTVDADPVPAGPPEAPSKKNPELYKGVAKIKAEFVKPIVRVAKEEKQSSGKEAVDAKEEGDKKKADSSGAAGVVAEKSEEERKRKGEEGEEDGGESKRQKRQRGQNKKRPRNNRLTSGESLCKAFVSEKGCSYENCKYSHDVKGYLERKPADLGETCVNFEVKGECRFGITCRFHKQHTAEGGKQIVNEEKKKYVAEHPVETNILTREMQAKLRKREIRFPVSDSYVSCSKKANSRRNNNKSSDGEKPPANMSVSCEAVSNMFKKLVDEDVEDMLLQEGVSLTSRKGIVSYKDEEGIKFRTVEKKQVDFSDKLYLAPLTTVGNLPFRRIGKEFGADITCGEMAMSTQLLQGHMSEWALVNRHHTEDIFGIQVCGSFSDTMSRSAELLCNYSDVDFIDINCGCPIDLVFNKGAGSALIGRSERLETIVRGMSSVMSIPLTLKTRTGIKSKQSVTHKLAPQIRDWGVSVLTVHGRSREQRYTSLANWDYVYDVAKACRPLPVFGNGDILTYEDYNDHVKRLNESNDSDVKFTGAMIARGALIKPWVFQEIKEQRHWDISSGERFDILKRFCNYGLEHWGSDTAGVENTRRFLLEWLSFLYRYVPVGLLEVVPQRMNQRPEAFYGRNDLETLMGSPDCKDWVKLSEMLLGPTHPDFEFVPKHKANSYS